MMWKEKLITPAIRADILGFFNSLRKIRDKCAHPGGDLYLSTDSLAPFLDAAKCMRSSLHNAIKTYWAERGPPY